MIKVLSGCFRYTLRVLSYSFCWLLWPLYERAMWWAATREHPPARPDADSSALTAGEDREPVPPAHWVPYPRAARSRLRNPGGPLPSNRGETSGRNLY